ncbi:MAG TPA: PAS domain-containing protein, partial [Gemmataceae bacterium]|nr:PAS domain-containing protein [Gemmataceae bacterium]
PGAEIASRILRTLARPASAAASERPERVRFRGEEFELTTEKTQLMHVLLSAFEDLLQLDQRNKEELGRRTRAEEHLQQAQAELELRVRERTAELAKVNEELRRTIAEQRRTEEALRLRDRWLEALPQGVVITDPSLPDNPIIYANRGFERLTGYSQNGFLGKNPRFLQGPGSDPEAVAKLRTALREERPCLVEVLNYRKDGSSFWNALSIAPVRDASGKTSHFVGVQTDITEFKRLEEQVRQAQKMEAFGQLAGSVAHDFNNLLTIINGYSELLLNMLPVEEPARELVREVLRAGERSAALTRQLLAFGRRQILEPKVLDLNALVRDTEQLLRRVLGEHIELTLSLEPGLGWVKVDRGQIEQVLMNLAVNARDAMPEGGTLRIATGNVVLDESYAETHPQVHAGWYVMLAVSDTGCGMDESIQARIFEPFFTTKGPGRGTGLGLATVHGIVRQSGGRIEVHSAVGRGTTFKIYLPRVEGASPSAKSSAGLSTRPAGTETVLLVEDEEAVRQLATLALRMSGYTILEAGSGEEAIQLCEQYPGPIHLILTDVVMPRMGGRELVDRLRAIRPELKILYLSGYTDDAMIHRGALEAEAAFLQKPFTTPALTRKVREVLDGL